MKIEYDIIEKTTIEKFAEKHDLTMEVKERRFPSESSVFPRNDQYYAHFKGSETRRGSHLVRESGNGHTPGAAIADYVRKISGATLVFDAHADEQNRYFHRATLCFDLIIRQILYKSKRFLMKISVVLIQSVEKEFRKSGYSQKTVRIYRGDLCGD